MGGGLTYLQSVIRELANSEFRWHLSVPRDTLAQIELPSGWSASVAPPLRFFGKHAWEQLVLPILARKWGASVTLCNANYVPLACPRPLPILHAPTTAGMIHATTLRQNFYWRALHFMTELSLWRSKCGIAIADIAEDYRYGSKLVKKGRLFYAPPGRPATRTAPIEKDPELVVAVGNIFPSKRYDVLVRSIGLLARRRPNIRLEIIGHAFDTAAHGQLHQLVAELKLEDQVTIRGFLPHEQVLHRIAQASILVSASVTEVANLVVLEAMSVGTPVILADTHAQRNLAGSAALFVKSDSDDPSSCYAIAIEEALVNCEKRRTMAEAGRQRAEEFNWTRTASAILNGVRSVIGGPNRNSARS